MLGAGMLGGGQPFLQDPGWTYLVYCVFFSTFSTKGEEMSRKPYRNTRLSMERLEGRCMMAGNVLVSVVDGDLVIEGDRLDNDIAVLPRKAAGEYRIFSRGNTTTVNGHADEVVSGVDGDFRIRMKGGHDVVSIARLDVPADLIVDTNSGKDTFNILSCNVGGDAIVDTAGGRDTVSFYATYVADDLLIETHGSRDEVWLADLAVDGDTFVRTHAGNDKIDVRRSLFGGQLTVRSDDGKDRLQLVDSNILDDAIVNTASDNDRLLITGTRVADRFRVVTGGGADNVSVRTDAVFGTDER